MYLNDAKTRDLMKELNKFFESYITISRLQVGKKQSIETLINEEALLLVKFLRGDHKIWVPRISSINEAVVV